MDLAQKNLTTCELKIEVAVSEILIALTLTTCKNPRVRENEGGGG